MARHTRESATEFERALELNPNFAAAHGYLGWAYAFDDQSEKAITHLDEAMRMSPHDPQNAGRASMSRALRRPPPRRGERCIGADEDDLSGAVARLDRAERAVHACDHGQVFRRDGQSRSAV